MRMLKGYKYLFSRIAFLTVLMFVLAAAPAGADTFGFYNITANDLGDAAIGEAQLFVDVTDNGSDQVLFTFTNTDIEACSIADVYFADGSLLEIATITSSTGVSFSELADPGELPGGNDIDPAFVTTEGFSADSDAPPSHNGVDNPDEWLGIVFNLQDSQTFEDVLDQLGTGELRIGIHVQGFDNSEGSESFVNNDTPVPIPASVLLLGSGLIGLVGFRRKKRIAK